MKEYHKIQTIFKRDQKTNRIIEGQYSLSEFELLKDVPWVWTEKVDGTNIRIMWNGETITFGGKSDNAQIPQFLVNRLNEVFLPIEQRLKFKEIFADAKEVCLYGEGYGAKIQSGGNYKGTQDFVLFDVKIGDWWLERENVVDIGTKLGLDIVPIVLEGTIADAIGHVRVGMKSTWGDFTAEGLVGRPKVELRTRRGDRIITKIKHKDFSA